MRDQFGRSIPKKKRFVTIALVVFLFIFVVAYFSLVKALFSPKENEIQPLERIIYVNRTVFIDKVVTLECPSKEPATSLALLQKEENLVVKSNETKENGGEISIAVIVFAYNRPDYLKRTLDSIFSYAPSYVSVIVSQDANDENVARVAREYPRVVHLQNLFRAPPQKDSAHELEGYYFLSSHYKFGLSNAFDKLHFKNVIILEDDMDIAPDFFDYFESMIPIMRSDPTIITVSAWNDNGRDGLVSDPEMLYRSDLPPGLGWMITDEIWNDLGPKWPKAYWDDWLRLKAQRKGRSSIRPEVSRTYTFGSQGTSAGQFYDQYLKNIKLNDKKIDWKEKDLSFLRKELYDKKMKERIEKATEIEDLKQISEGGSEEYVLRYKLGQFDSLARTLGIMADEKDGIRRTAYEGVISLRRKGHLLMLIAER